jgi:heme-degrading monooxygenase HmoA
MKINALWQSGSLREVQFCCAAGCDSSPLPPHVGSLLLDVARGEEGQGEGEIAVFFGPLTLALPPQRSCLLRTNAHRGGEGTATALQSLFFGVHPFHEDDEYDQMAEQMERLAAEQDGFLGVESARGNNRLGITISYWSSPEAAGVFRRDSEHLAAQRLGREQWYRRYIVRLCRVEAVRDYIQHDHSESHHDVD